MSNSEYTRERYQFLKSHGICVNCGNENACIGSIYCLKCWEKHHETINKYQASHSEENKKRCKEYNKRIYAERKAKGLCVKCGYKAIDGRTLCLSCSVKAKKRKDPRWNNDIERSMRPEMGLCYVCGKPLNKWDELCDDCHDKSSDRMKKLNANPTEAMLKAREEYTLRFRQFHEKLYFERLNRKKSREEVLKKYRVEKGEAQ